MVKPPHDEETLQEHCTIQQEIYIVQTPSEDSQQFILFLDLHQVIN